MGFMDNFQDTLNNENGFTENGAIGYRTTGKELLDINFLITSMRNWSDKRIENKFAKVFYKDKMLAVKWLFFARDIREGLGERRIFKIAIKYLANNHPSIVKAVAELIPVYGRYDDLWCLLDTKLNDKNNFIYNRPISLLVKWLPSTNTSSVKTVKKARQIYKALKISEREYRKTLSSLRRYIGITERLMSAKKWNEIKYENVPSKANLIYNKAFLKNDLERRIRFLNKLSRGEIKINSSVLFPHDIVHKYICHNAWYIELNDYNETLEQMWKALPDYVKGHGSTICVADGSGSMLSTIGNTNITCLEIANSLAIYFAERCNGMFKDKYITFSQQPQLVDLSKGNCLKDKIEISLRYNEMSITNIKAVFDLILNTALENQISQSELPKNVLILSDMEFDKGTSKTDTLFTEIKNKYAKHGYKLPKLIFWNINSRSEVIPAKENKLGVSLVSGFSPTIMKMVLSETIDPFQCLLEQLNSERYKPIEEALTTQLC